MKKMVYLLMILLSFMAACSNVDELNFGYKGNNDIAVKANIENKYKRDTIMLGEYNPLTRSGFVPYLVKIPVSNTSTRYELYGVPVRQSQNTKSYFFEKDGGENLLASGLYIFDTYSITARVLTPSNGTITVDPSHAGWSLALPNYQERTIYFQYVTVNGRSFVDFYTGVFYIKTNPSGISINRYYPIDPNDVVIAYYVNQ